MAEAETRCPAFSFCCEERFEAPAAGFLVHAVAGVCHLDMHRPAGLASISVTAGRLRFAAMSVPPDCHGVHGVEDEIGEGFADFTFDSGNRGQVLLQFRAHVNHDAPLLRHVAPVRAREIQHTCPTRGR